MQQQAAATVATAQQLWRTAVSSNYPKFKYTSPRLRERNRPPPASGSSDRAAQAERPPKFKQGQAATIAATAQPCAIFQPTKATFQPIRRRRPWS